MTGIAVPAPAPPAPPRERGTLRIAGGVLLALVAGLAAGALVAAVVATRFFDFEVLTVSSGSMAPAIESGDLVVVRPVAIDTVETGDVVLFEAGGDDVPTLHRVIGVNEIEIHIRDAATGLVETSTHPRLVTMGDANPAPDSREVTAEQLRGRVWFTVPNAGAVAGAGIVVLFGALLALTVLAWVAWEIVLRVRDSREAPEVGR